MATGGNRVCSVIACTGESIDTCGRRFENYISNTTGIFEELRIIATLPTPRKDNELDADRSAYFPVTLNTEIMPLRSDDYTFQQLSILNIVSIYDFLLTNTNVELYTFAIWGREYTTDAQLASPPSNQHDSAETTTTTTTTPTPTTAQPGSSTTHRINFILFIGSIIIYLR
ncbi:unnamed protein product [Euphydryas editha]|nr:unnamed protein product [Euphydryas editha]